VSGSEVRCIGHRDISDILRSGKSFIPFVFGLFVVGYYKPFALGLGSWCALLRWLPLRHAGMSVQSGYMQFYNKALL
jgi:hypothetical protein